MAMNVATVTTVFVALTATVAPQTGLQMEALMANAAAQLRRSEKLFGVSNATLTMLVLVAATVATAASPGRSSIKTVQPLTAGAGTGGATDKLKQKVLDF